MLVPKPSKQKKQIDPVIPEAINIDNYLVDLNKPVTQEVIFKIENKIILTYGSLMILTGKPKARKTTFLHAFIASAITYQNIWSITTSLKPDKNLVVLLDTEQSMYDLHQSLGRLENTINTKLSSLINFKAYSARSLNVDEIINLITRICEINKNIGLICIDGLLDLVYDINDVREAKAAIHFLKNLSDTYQVGIVGILHQNKGTNFSLGHLGSFASRHAQSELSIEKNDSGTSTLSSTFLRSADDIKPIEIEYDDINQKYQVINSQNIKQNYISFELINKVFNGKIGLTYKDFVSQCRININESGYYIEKKLIPVWFAEKMIEKNGSFIQLVNN
jgi:hypothetical protein